MRQPRPLLPRRTAPSTLLCLTPPLPSTSPTFRPKTLLLLLLSLPLRDLRLELPLNPPMTPLTWRNHWPDQEPCRPPRNPATRYLEPRSTRCPPTVTTRAPHPRSSRRQRSSSPTLELRSLRCRTSSPALTWVRRSRALSGTSRPRRLRSFRLRCPRTLRGTS
jgi:hypothetical protein